MADTAAQDRRPAPDLRGAASALLRPHRRAPERLAPRPLVRPQAPWLIAAGAILALVLLPIGGLVFFAARGSGDLWPHLAAYVLPNALRTTGLMLAGVGALVTALGVGAAWLVTACRFPGRRLFEWALLLPLAVPSYIAAYAYLDVMHPVGPVQSWLRGLLGIADPLGLGLPDIRSLAGCILLLGFCLYPYVYLPTRALFLMESAATLEAARQLGAGPAHLFLRVALPLARPAVAIGCALALMEALNDIGASSFLGVRTLTVAVYDTWVTRSSIEGASQIALAMLAVVMLLFLLERWAQRRRDVAVQEHDGEPTPPPPLRPAAALAAIAACTLPVLIGFGIPAAYLVAQAARRVAQSGLPRDLMAWIGNSVGVSLAATVIALVFGLVLGFAGRLAPGPLGRSIVRLGGMGYAIPGTVLAAGLLVPLAAFDNAVDAASRSLTGLSTGLLISASGGALAIAYVVRFLAISAGSIESGLAKINPATDMAARTLGAGTLATLLRLHVPLLGPALAAGALLVFVDCMKELPATLLLRPFNFETLSTHIFGEAKRGTYEDGAVAALAIVLVSLPAVLLLGQAARRLGRTRATSGEAGIAGRWPGFGANPPIP